MIFHWTGVKLTVWSQVGSWTPSQQRSTSSQITPGTINNKYKYNYQQLQNANKTFLYSRDSSGDSDGSRRSRSRWNATRYCYSTTSSPYPDHFLSVSCGYLLTFDLWHQTSYSCIIWSISLNNTSRTTERLLIRISEAGFAYSSTVRLVDPCWTSFIQIDSNWVNVNLSKVPVQVDISVTERVGLWNSQVSVWIALKIGL